MRIHHLQHVPFEGLSSIETFFQGKDYQLSATKLYENQPLPSVNDVDWLIVMGGPMGVYDEDTYPWLAEEKLFIKEAINSGKIILGICLGAQLIAEVLGAEVYQNKCREIGWFNVSRSAGVINTILSDVIPEQAEVFHWHGDTFDIPEGAHVIAESEACSNQGFIMNDRIVAFQFHLETTLESATALIENCSNDLDGSQYVQTKNEMLSKVHRFTSINNLMFSVLETLDTKYT